MNINIKERIFILVEKKYLEYVLLFIYSLSKYIYFCQVQWNFVQKGHSIEHNGRQNYPY